MQQDLGRLGFRQNPPVDSVSQSAIEERRIEFAHNRIRHFATIDGMRSGRCGARGADFHVCLFVCFFYCCCRVVFAKAIRHHGDFGGPCIIYILFHVNFNHFHKDLTFPIYFYFGGR